MELQYYVLILNILLLSYAYVVFSAGEKVSLTKQEVIDRFRHNDVVPDVIDIPPVEVLFVQWGNSTVADLKHELTPTEVSKEPKVNWDGGVPRKFYTLVMVDPDIESNLAEVQHWIVGNIPGENISKGDVLTAYVGSGPPKDGGLHRYVFLLFEQKQKINFNEPRLLFPSPTGLKDRVKFSVRNFVKKYNLGSPIRGNFYFAQWDESVPSLLRQLGA